MIQPTPPVVTRAVQSTAIYRFGSSYDKSIGYIPGFYSSKSFTGEDPSQRVKWRTISFHGYGTLNVSVYVDGVLIVQSKMTMTERPDQERVLNLPRGRSSGYALRYEYQIESGYIRLAEIYYEPIGSDVN